jgi:hypothetical protein
MEYIEKKAPLIMVIGPQGYGKTKRMNNYLNFRIRIESKTKIIKITHSSKENSGDESLPLNGIECCYQSKIESSYIGYDIIAIDDFHLFDDDKLPDRVINYLRNGITVIVNGLISEPNIPFTPYSSVIWLMGYANNITLVAGIPFKEVDDQYNRHVTDHEDRYNQERYDQDKRAHDDEMKEIQSLIDYVSSDDCDFDVLLDRIKKLS